MQGLIVNADDFGFSQQINQGVCEAHVNGIVTDASLLVRSPYASQAIEMANQINLPVGLHIDFVTPYSASLRKELGPNGHLTQELFNREYKDQVTSLFSTEELLQIQDEIKSQIEDFIALAGHSPSHLDYHFGLHFLPDVMFIYLSAANQYHLPVRWGVQYAGRNPVVLAPARLCDKFRGVKNSSIQTFTDLLEEPWEGALEVLCHPGYFTPNGFFDSYNQEREYELEILTDPQLKADIEHMGIHLVNYNWLQEHGNSFLNNVHS
jgi:chitin disaccharide deacetylase